MVRKVIKITFAVFYLMLILLFGGCNSISTDVPMNEYYTIEDFNSITINESTHQDVYDIAPCKSMYMTSYGGLCEYPAKNGGYICIKFYGKDLTVGSIEYVVSSIKE